MINVSDALEGHDGPQRQAFLLGHAAAELWNGQASGAQVAQRYGGVIRENRAGEIV
jgi:hypothetical protein